LSDFIDADDRRLIVQGVLLLFLAAIVLLALAATAGLAWSVFRLVGGF